MIDAPCSRKSFLAFGLCTLASGLVGCSDEAATTPGPVGSGGAGGAGTGGAGGTSGTGGGTSGTGGGTSGTGGSAGTAGTGGGTSGTGGSAGTAGSGGGGAGGSAGSAGTAGGGGTGGAGPACNSQIIALCSPEADDGHTHQLIITPEVITAGVDIEIDTEDDLTEHNHTIAFTAADFTTLKAGGVVTKDDCGGGPHQFIISCASPPEPVEPDCG